MAFLAFTTSVVRLSTRVVCSFAYCQYGFNAQCGPLFICPVWPFVFIAQCGLTSPRVALWLTPSVAHFIYCPVWPFLAQGGLVAIAKVAYSDHPVWPFIAQCGPLVVYDGPV